jgi:hypothetical protein
MQRLRDGRLLQNLSCQKHRIERRLRQREKAFFPFTGARLERKAVQAIVEDSCGHLRIKLL